MREAICECETMWKGFAAAQRRGLRDEELRRGETELKDCWHLIRCTKSAM
jgi:hypothetical protein